MMSIPRLISLRDMLEIKAGSFSRALHWLGKFNGLTQQTTAEPEFHDSALPLEVRRTVLEEMRALRTELVSLNVPVTLTAAARFIQLLESSADQLTFGDLHFFSDTIESRLYDELASSSLFALSPREAEAYKSDGFPAQVHSRFPSLAFELDEASKCLALGRYTAAVFHWMRVVESGLRAVRLCLGCSAAPLGHGRNWGEILRELRDARRGNPPKWPENDYFSAIYALVEAVMNAWRNSTMHIENKYTQEEAEAIRECVKSLLTKIASRMDENGLPLA